MHDDFEQTKKVIFLMIKILHSISEVFWNLFTEI